MSRFILILLISFVAVTTGAQTSTDTTCIIDVLAEHVTLVQPRGLSQRLAPGADIRTNYKDRRDKKVDPSIRYRVQVYSDNNRQSAKANAEYRKRIVEQRMPGVHAYVTYDAPYWRVRVGNYQTEAEAITAMKQVKSQFPAFSNDVRVVKVRVGN